MLRHNNRLEDGISTKTDGRLDFLCTFGDMACQMKPSSKQKNEATYAHDTANAVYNMLWNDRSM